ncbi:heavy-metal-associated domain-containing protein [Listeria costaricensis]|uniref:heavy-metal-associated domain-containing protein n=1 Tax=Listeria costaricensis TaxID=2026604 RepID=UPI000C072BD4|nr:copper ion binding protein [Listeria costaricensis]
MEKILKIDGMSCGHCKKRVEDALSGMQGVKSAQVSLEKEEAVVSYDATALQEADLVEAVEEAGYEVIE